MIQIHWTKKKLVVTVLFVYTTLQYSINIDINISVDESSYLLGYSKKKTFMNIHLPFLRNSLLFVGILISLEIIRELPITLILRPFDFNTLAVRTFELASDERLADSSTSALAIVLAGLLPVIYLSQTISKTRLK